MGEPLGLELCDRCGERARLGPYCTYCQSEDPAKCERVKDAVFARKNAHRSQWDRPIRGEEPPEIRR